MIALLSGLVALLAAAPSATAQDTAVGGRLTTVSTPGYTLNGPQGVAVDGGGNLYIADGANSRVLEIPSNCTGSGCVVIFTTPTWPNGLAIDRAGNLFILGGNCYGCTFLLKAPAGCASSSCEISIPVGQLHDQQGIAVDDAGDLFVADVDNGRVIEIPAGCTIAACQTTVPGGSYFGALGVAVDAQGDLFLTNLHNVLEIPAGCTSNSCQKTLGSGLQFAEGIVVDPIGNIFVSDANAGDVVEIAASGAQTTAVTGLAVPVQLAMSQQGQLFVADYNHNQIVEWEPAPNLGTANVCPGGTGPSPCSQSATLTFLFNAPDTGIAPSVVTQGASGLDFTNTGGGTCDTNGTSYAYNIGATCTVNVQFAPTKPGARFGAVVLKDATGVAATTYLRGTGTGPQIAFAPPAQIKLGGGFSNPFAVAVDGAGDIDVADQGNGVVRTMPPGCASQSCAAATLGGSFGSPTGVAVDGAGNIYVVDSSATKLDRMPPGCTSSSCVTTLVSGIPNPNGVALDGSGNVYIADFGDSSVKVISPACMSAACMVTLGGGFSSPYGVAVDGSGNVFVADTSNNAVKAMPPGCLSSSCVKTLGGGFSSPNGVAVDGIGNVFVADTGHGAVKEMPPGCGSASCVTTVSSGLGSPTGLALDGSGNLYVANYGTTGVSQFSFAVPPSTSFPTTTDTGVLDATDGPLGFTVENIGNAPLLFSVPSTGFNPSVAAGFLWNSTSTCTQIPSGASAFSLAPASACSIAIDFEPTSPGANSGSLVLTDNTLNATNAVQSASLSGTASAVALQLSPSSLPNATAGANYLAQLSAAGGSGAYTFSAIGLPTGLSLNTTTNQITGMCTAGSSSVVLSVKDAGEGTASVGPLSVACNAAPAIATATLPATYLNLAYTTPIAATGGTPPLVFSLTSPVPAGFTIDPGSGTLSGTAPSSPTTLTFNIQVSDSWGATGTKQLTLTVNNIPSYVVTTAIDDAAANAANCPGANCSLRDAMTAAVNAGEGNITFDSTVLNQATTITLISPLPTLNGGPFLIGSPSANLVTISAGNSTAASPMLTLLANTTATVEGLTFTGGNAQNGLQDGGAILNRGGSLSLVADTFSGNTAGFSGGAVYNGGTLSVTGSTFSENQAQTHGGGAIYSGTGQLTVQYSTFSGNSAPSGNGGAIVVFGNATVQNSTFAGNRALNGGAVAKFGSPGTLALTNSILSGNSGQTGAAVENAATSNYNLFYNNFDPGTTTEDDCYGCALNTGAVSGNPNLAPLGNYGGTTATMLPLPGSAAICAGSPALLPTGVTLDQRSQTNTNVTYPGYSAGTACVDLGAVETNYAMSFSTPPPATGTVPGAAMSPAPAVTLTESGAPFTAGTAAMSATDINADLTTSPATASITSGVATFGSLLFNSATSGDKLTATLPLNPALTPVLTLSTQSTAFSVGTLTPIITWPTASAITYGQPLASSTLTGGSGSFNNTPVAGTFAFTTPATAPNAGLQSESVTFTPSSTGQYSPVTTTLSVQVNKAPTQVTVLPTASAITQGQSLASSTLSGGAAVSTITGAAVPGSFAFATPSAAPPSTGAQSVTFTPTDTRNYLGTTTAVSVTVNPPAKAPVAKINPTAIDFGTLYLGNIATRAVTITNTGNAPMTITDRRIATVSGGDSHEFISFNFCPRSLAPGKSCTMTVTFIAGPFYNPQTATLMISDNAAGSPQLVPLKATVLNPVARFSTRDVDFGKVKNGNTASRSVAIVSVGGTAVSISSIAISGAGAGEFSETNTCSSTSLNPKATCSITTTFKPTSRGSRSARLLVTSNAWNSPRWISLSGTGD